MLSFNGGVYTAFVGERESRSCDVLCGVGLVVQDGAERLRELGREVDQMRLKLEREVTAETAGPALATWIKESRDTAIDGAHPVPPEIRAKLQGWYPDSLFDVAKFKTGDGGALNLANNIISFGQASAVTLIDVIIFQGPSEAASPSLWVHEMKHIEQFQAMGVKDLPRDTFELEVKTLKIRPMRSRISGIVSDSKNHNRAF